jgi:hypothetical protein
MSNGAQPSEFWFAIIQEHRHHGSFRAPEIRRAGREIAGRVENYFENRKVGRRLVWHPVRFTILTLSSLPYYPSGEKGSGRSDCVKELVEYIARSLVDQIDWVEVAQMRGPAGRVRLELRVARG